VIGPILLVAAILATTPAVVEAQAKKVLPVDEAEAPIRSRAGSSSATPSGPREA